MISVHGGTDLANNGVTIREEIREEIRYTYKVIGPISPNMIKFPDHSFDKPLRILDTRTDGRSTNNPLRSMTKRRKLLCIGCLRYHIHKIYNFLLSAFSYLEGVFVDGSVAARAKVTGRSLVLF